MKMKPISQEAADALVGLAGGRQMPMYELDPRVREPLRQRNLVNWRPKVNPIYGWVITEEGRIWVENHLRELRQEEKSRRGT